MVIQTRRFLKPFLNSMVAMSLVIFTIMDAIRNLNIFLFLLLGSLDCDFLKTMIFLWKKVPYLDGILYVIWT